MKVIWTNESLNRLIEIEDYISKDSPNRAIKFIDRIINRGESLAQFPNKGRIVLEFSIPEIREILEQNYRIVYRITKTRIEILTIFEGHRLIRTQEIFKNK
jgi:toxin ParE1/3/4